MSRPLPARPNLEYLKKYAKELLQQQRQQNPSAKLADAQHAVAVEYGFSSWATLKADVGASPDTFRSSACGSSIRRGLHTTPRFSAVPGDPTNRVVRGASAPDDSQPSTPAPSWSAMTSTWPALQARDQRACRDLLRPAIPPEH